MLSIENVEQEIQENMATMLYFSSPDCSVCHVLKPKLSTAIKENFPAFKIIHIDISQEMELAPHFGVFAAPTIIIYLDGKEFLKKSRNMSVDGVINEIKRPYEIMLG